MLPESIKKEISDYMDFLMSKKQKKNKPKKQLKAGFMKGTFKMSPDFDDPMEDFKDYME